MGAESRWTQADVDAVNAKRGAIVPAHLPPPKTRAKYGNQKITLNGTVFDSKKEAQRYHDLKLLERAGRIDALDCHPRFELYIDTVDRGRIVIGHYTADFSYWERHTSGAIWRIEDVKSTATKTTAYQLRKKLVEAIYNITITEV